VTGTYPVTVTVLQVMKTAQRLGPSLDEVADLSTPSVIMNAPRATDINLSLNTSEVPGGHRA
jgi:hypothetical protein